MFVGKQAWNPWIILAQIGILQCVYYAGAAVLAAIIVGVTTTVNTPHAPYMTTGFADYLLNWRHTAGGAFTSWMICLSSLLNACISAVALRFVVMRAKRCWDYGATIYILHLLACALWAGFPLGWMWWALQGTCCAVTILLGELLCVRFEMADIPLAGVATRRLAPRRHTDDEVVPRPETELTTLV